MDHLTYENGGYREFQSFLEAQGEDNSRQRRRLLQNLRRAMAQELTAKEREALELYYMAGENIPAIARRLGIHKSNVCRRIQRGKRKLRRCLRYGAAALLQEE